MDGMIEWNKIWWRKNMNWKDDKEFVLWYERFYDLCCTYGFGKEYTDKEFLFNMEQHKVSSPEDRMIELLQSRIDTDQMNLYELLEREDNE